LLELFGKIFLNHLLAKLDRGIARALPETAGMARSIAVFEMMVAT
jgi:hypothetical protein